MFHLSYTTPYKGEIKTLRLTRDPWRHGLGHYKDVDGTVWDIHSLMGKTYTGHDRNYVHARTVAGRDNYYGTATNCSSNGFHTWLPFYVEVVA